MSAIQGGAAGSALGAHSKDAAGSGGPAAGTRPGVPAVSGVSRGGDSIGASIDRVLDWVDEHRGRIKARPLRAVLIAAGTGYLLRRIIR